jgi:hypothetical protein
MIKVYDFVTYVLVHQNLLHDNIFMTIDMNFQLPYDRFMKLLYAFSYAI